MVARIWLKMLNIPIFKSRSYFGFFTWWHVLNMQFFKQISTHLNRLSRYSIIWTLEVRSSWNLNGILCTTYCSMMLWVDKCWNKDSGPLQGPDMLIRWTISSRNVHTNSQGTDLRRTITTKTKITNCPVSIAYWIPYEGDTDFEAKINYQFTY